MAGFRIFVLGAGFSRAAGLPLADELWKEILVRASRLGGRGRKFSDDLDEFVEFKRKCSGLDLSRDQVDFEEFMAFLDVEHYLGLRGSDTWSRDGNESQVIVKTLIGQILTERTPSIDSLPAIYYDFAKCLGQHDCVLTFNYDLVLERALEHIGKPYRLFPDRYKEVSEMSGIVDSDADEVTILKLHGSVDWFDRSGYATLERIFIKEGATSKPTHPVFGPDSGIRTTPLLDGPQLSDDTMLKMHRAANIEDLYAKGVTFLHAPWLLSPSSAKVVYASKMKSYWWGLGQAGAMNLGLAIIGYSLPEHDDYARQLLFRLVRNYQDNWWGEDFREMGTKGPVVLVDCQPSDEAETAYRARYRFVDIDKAVFVLDGFSEAAIAAIRGASPSG